MADAIVPASYRQTLAAGMRAGGATIAPITHMAFGDGGHNADNSVKPSGQAALYHERLRKPLDLVLNEDPLSCTGRGSIAQSELIGVTVSEAALLDSGGRVVGMITFPPKVKDGTEAFEFSLKVKF
jgi:hypothetical protein